MKLQFAAVAAALLLSACNPQDNASTPPASATGPAPAAEQAAPAAEQAAPATAELHVVSWGPKTTAAGTAFNAQPDGNSGLFFELDNTVPAVPFAVSFAGKPLSGVVASGKVVTATVPADYLSAAGSFPIVIEVPSTGARIEVGSFEVTAP
jgi:hypothetical protein